MSSLESRLGLTLTLALALGLSVGSLGCSGGSSSGHGAAASSAAGVNSGGPSATNSGSSSAPLGTQVALVNAFAATGLGGVYQVAGVDPTRGAYAGQVELRWEGSDYAFLREVEYTSYRHQGRPVSLVWTGRARDQAGGVTLDLSLRRMGFAAEAEGIAPRTRADGQAMRVQATFAPQAGGGLQGSYRGQGAPFTDPAEDWTFLRGPGVAPIWSLERTLEASHSAPSRTTKFLMFALFNDFHRTAWISPYTGRAEFQAAVHKFTYDRTDFALHRARPDLLRLIDTVVDELNLHEAKIKADAFGKTLALKASEADADVPARFLEPTAGCLVERTTAGGTEDDNDGNLWTGAYCYSQALRYATTQDPRARDNMLRTARSLDIMLRVSGRGDDFARTVRTAGLRPLGTKWLPGAGQFSHLEWKIGGNNDMWKGFLLGGLALLEGPGQPLRQDYGAALAALARTHDVTKGSRRVGNRLITWGTVAALTGDSQAASEYRRHARNPFQAAYDVAVGGGFHYKGIADWSGTHLNIVGLMLSARLAEHNNYWLAKPISRLALQRAARATTSIRRSLHMIVAAGLAPSSSLDPSDAIWALRELPQPRSLVGVGASFHDTFSASPIPNLPWKRDWTTNQGRAKGIVAPPLWEEPQGAYVWKNNPFPDVVDGGGPRTHDNAAGGYLLAYWFGRRHGVISATE